MCCYDAPQDKLHRKYTFSASDRMWLSFAIQVPLSAVSLRHFCPSAHDTGQRTVKYGRLVSCFSASTSCSHCSRSGREAQNTDTRAPDIMTISPVIKDIILSIAGKATELVLVGALFIITCVIYAAFGMAVH